jgi:hypothetical protein
MANRLAPFLVFGAAMGLLPGTSVAERMSYLDNGTIRIGVDLDLGGSITHLSMSRNGENLINSHDLGRQVQQSYYSGPKPFGQAHPGWKDWPWNPIGSGDVYGHPSRVLNHSNDGKVLYVETTPMQWALNGVPGDCTFETWITLEGNSALVRCRLNNRRVDRTQYPAQPQELPAVYTVGRFHRLFTYDGPDPFTGAPLRQVQNSGPPWTFWTASENWAALVDDGGRGVGVVHPGVYSFIGGFHGEPGRGGPQDDPTGYIAPVRKEVLDHDIVYEYRYALVLGTVEEIRAYAVAHRVRDTRPDYRFTYDRQHWTYADASDAGFPPEGGLRVRPGRGDPQLIGPEQWWDAASVPKLYIRAAYRTGPGKAEVYWSVPGEADFSLERRVAFEIRPDGEPYTYEVDLASAPNYRGTITGLRFDPVASGREGEEVRIEFISWKDR